MKIYTLNLGGNLHDAGHEVNRRGLAQYLLSLTPVGTYNVIATFRMPDDLVVKLRRDDPSYTADPKHDWPEKPTY